MSHSALESSSGNFRSESKRFGELIRRHIALRLDRLFDPSARGLSRRRLVVVIGILVFFGVSFAAHNTLRSSTFGDLPQNGNLRNLLPIVLLTGLRLMSLLAIATFLGVHFAGRFLADIFEVSDARIAWRFLAGLAGGRATEVIHLSRGAVSDADRKSPIMQIGGPGWVVVDDETAGLFEKSDGTPHVVGIRGSAESHRIRGAEGTFIDAFERLREPIISLRDQYIGNPSGEPLTVVGRSLEGMPVSVTDVRGVFSVRREAASAKQASSLTRPFPFRPQDIERLIYHQAVEVLTSGEDASSLPGDWSAGMKVLIGESLREFMGQNRLSEFMAGVGSQEAELAEFRADVILSKTVEISNEVSRSLPIGLSSTPHLRPRTELSSKFKKYGSEFAVRAQELGLELHWIGVGTWRIPDETSEATVSSKHLEAWRMNRENADRASSSALEQISERALLEAKVGLIRDVPLIHHQNNLLKYNDRIVLMECLLEDFREQLGGALDVYYRNGVASADAAELERAILKIEGLLRISQLGQGTQGVVASRIRARSPLSSNAPPAPASRSEATQYQELLGKLQGDYRVAEAMIANEQRRHGELSREQLIARIVERFERHGR